ncbi:TPA: hypothetical protein ACGO91_000466 [Streptococcus suis]
MVATIQNKEIDAVNAATPSNKLLQMSNGAIYNDDKGTVFITKNIV